MSRSTPSLLALLGLVAVAGYQNRNKISEMLSDARQGDPRDPSTANTSTGAQPDNGFLSEIGRLFGAGAGGGTLVSGIGDLINRFKEAGRAEPVDSWVSSEPNMPVEAEELEAALGDETLEELSRKTGLSRSELLLRLKGALPEVVDRFTPDGRMPTEPEARAFD